MELIAQYPAMKFLPAGYFAYDAAEEVVNYDPVRLQSQSGQLALLHEISHATLGHFHYRFDFELFVMEARAWHLTRELAKQHGVDVDEAYIEDCIDSYDEWLTKRATCPGCGTFNIQSVPNEFECYACQTSWKVSEDLQKTVQRKIISQQQY